jgi:hypothetical protein
MWILVVTLLTMDHHVKTETLGTFAMQSQCEHTRTLMHDQISAEQLKSASITLSCITKA